MPERGDLACPEMAGATCLDADQRLRLRLEEAEYLATAELPAQHNLASSVDRMHLEEVLCDVQADGDRDSLGGSLHGGRLLSLDASAAPSLAHRCRVGASTPSHLGAGAEVAGQRGWGACPQPRCNHLNHQSLTQTALRLSGDIQGGHVSPRHPPSRPPSGLTRPGRGLILQVQVGLTSISSSLTSSALNSAPEGQPL
jgi:hypothetical protein